MSQHPQSSSNETDFSFAAAVPAAINDTPGSVESGGGGTTSYRVPGSGASTNSFTVVSNTGSHRGSARRSTSTRSHRSARTELEGRLDVHRLLWLGIQVASVRRTWSRRTRCGPHYPGEHGDEGTIPCRIGKCSSSDSRTT